MNYITETEMIYVFTLFPPPLSLSPGWSAPRAAGHVFIRSVSEGLNMSNDIIHYYIAVHAQCNYMLTCKIRY